MIKIKKSTILDSGGCVSCPTKRDSQGFVIDSKVYEIELKSRGITSIIRLCTDCFEMLFRLFTELKSSDMSVAGEIGSGLGEVEYRTPKLELTPIYSDILPMRVAIFMSGKGSVAREIIKGSSSGLYEVAFIFSDNYDSAARKIGKDNCIPVLTIDYKSYRIMANYRHIFGHNSKWGQDHYYGLISEEIEKYAIDTIAYAGYMGIVKGSILNRYIGVNVHPADLSILNKDGSRKYVGAHAVKDAILAGEKYIRSTTHLVTKELDSGPIFEISDPVLVGNIPDKLSVDIFADIKQSELKEEGDFKIFPKTLNRIAQGRYLIDKDKSIIVSTESL